MRDFQTNQEEPWQVWAKHVLHTLERLEKDGKETSEELQLYKLDLEHRLGEMATEQAVSKTKLAILVAGITVVISIVTTLIAAYIEKN